MPKQKQVVVEPEPVETTPEQIDVVDVEKEDVVVLDPQPTGPGISPEDLATCAKVLTAAKRPVDEIAAVPMAVRLAHAWDRQGEMSRVDHAELDGLLRRVAELRRSITDPPNFLTVAVDWVVSTRHHAESLAKAKREAADAAEAARVKSAVDWVEYKFSPEGRLAALEAALADLRGKKTDAA